MYLQLQRPQAAAVTPSWDLAFADSIVGHTCALDKRQLVGHCAALEVVILLESGAEKPSYICGCARAFTWDGRHVELALSDTYKRIETELGVPAVGQRHAVPRCDR
jgi:hypothetical protein